MVQDISSLPAIVEILQGSARHILFLKHLLNIDLQHICTSSDTF